jgi:hypothetical protein
VRVRPIFAWFDLWIGASASPFLTTTSVCWPSIQKEADATDSA